jgi:pyruvate dehydrogenase E1 component alpha subunit
VYQVATEAVQRARAGDGPTLIESHTYRMSFHNTTDNPSLYEDPKERDEAKRRDPIDRVIKHLTQRGLWSEDRDKAIRATVRAEIDAALEKAATFPPPVPSDLFEHVYADLPARLRRQRADFLGEAPQS